MSIFTYTISSLSGYGRSNDTWFTVKYFIVAIVFLFLLWVVSKVIISQNGVKMRSNNMKVIERLSISKDKAILLVELDGIHYVIGSDRNNMVLLDKRDDLKIVHPQKIELNSGAFLEQLRKKINKNEDAENRSKDIDHE